MATSSGAQTHATGARVVRLTLRGQQAVAVIRAILLGIEHDWAERLGAERFAALKAMLEQMRGEPDAVERGRE